MTKTNTGSQRMVAITVAVFGLLLIVRWITNAPFLDGLIRNAPMLGLNTPLMLLATGTCLYLRTLPGAHAGVLRIVSALLNGLVASLSILILVEHLFHVSLGIDFVRAHVAPTFDTPTPGRVAPNTCVAFLSAAIAMHFASRATRSPGQRRLMVASVGAVMLIASTALVGHALDLSALYRFAQYNRMLPPTAAGLLLIAVGLWFKLQDLLDGEDSSVEAFERRITRRSAGILAMVAISTGVAGFAILEKGVEASATQNLMTTTVADGAALSATLEARLWYAEAMRTRPALVGALEVLRVQGRDRKALALLDEIGRGLVAAGVTWVRFADDRGNVLSEHGASDASPENLELPLHAAGQSATLVWHGVYFLQTATPIFVQGRLAGTVSLEQALPTFRAMIAAAESGNASTEVVICGRTPTDALCAPSRFYGKPRRIPLHATDAATRASSVPATLDRPALLHLQDIRGIAAVAGYTPLQSFGIGMIRKIDADSLVAPLREHLLELLLIVSGLVALGALLARLQILPLLAKVVYEQTRNAVILANANDAFIGMDAQGRVTDWNARAESMFHWPVEEALGRLVADLIVPPEHRHAHAEGVARFNVSGQGPLMNRQLEVMAMRRDGALVPVELSVTGFHDGKSHISNAFVRDISARKASEQKLADSERFLRTITDNLPAIVGYVDIDERYRFANSGYQTMMGIDPAAIIGRTIASVLGEATRLAIDPYIAQVKAGRAVHFERRGIEPGRPEYFSSDYIPDIAADGTVVGFFIHIVDISAKKRSESALRQSEQRLKAVTDNLPALITHVDTAERYLFVNAHVSTVFGVEPTRMIGRTIRQVGGDTFYESIAGQVRACLSGATVSFEGAVPAKGQELIFQANYVPEFDQDGAVIGFYAITFDITDRKREERLRRQSDERLRLITDNLPVLISYLDADRRFQFGNATFSTWLGTEPAELAGRFIADIVGAAAYEERRGYIDRAFAGETVHFDMTTVARGVRRVLQTVYVPHMRSSGEVDGLYTISTDVTALKDIEAALALQARVDPLTDLPNRRQFDERMDEALARQVRSTQPLAVMFLDVDRFKGINDGLGHAAGDEVLRQFAGRLRQSVRKTDIVARYAGDEFVIIIDGFKVPGELALIARKILASVRKPMIIGDMALHVTTSIGITEVDYRDRLAGPVIARADEALYSAKRAGRDRFHEWRATSAGHAGT